MVRRPMTTLVEQGILPSPKTSPFLHEQKQRLERAKMGDMLKAKIASRPDRQELVHRHILEDTPPGVDPSLCDKQRQLKRAKLADTLSHQLVHRPGPLELIQKNILHTDESVEQAVKEGQIQFKPTKEGVVMGGYNFDQEDDSNSSSGMLFKSDSANAIEENVVVSQGQMGSTLSTVRRSSDVGLFAVPQTTSTVTLTSKSISSSVLNHQNYSQREAPGKDQSRKKKSGASGSGVNKPRAIKFHEYKVRYHQVMAQKN